jgi:hypothetical protein
MAQQTSGTSFERVEMGILVTVSKFDNVPPCPKIKQHLSKLLTQLYAAFTHF